MDHYAMYLRKSRFDRDYAELSVEETLKRHETILNALAMERGYHVVKTYYEVVSGESIAARPQIQQLLEEVNAGAYAGVLVVDVERLARGNSADQAYISQIFQFSGTQIITPSKTYDPNNEFDQEYFEFGLFMSRREYKTINRRLIRGRESSAAEGKYLGSIAPYGYRREKLKQEKGYTLAAEPEEAAVVQRIFALYLAGEGTKRIAHLLNDEGVPTRRGEGWSHHAVDRILRNPVYMGLIKRGACKQIKTVVNGQVVKKIHRFKEMADYAVFPGLHPALIARETYEEAQQLRKTRRPEVRVKTGTPLQNAFAGLIFCARCGKRVERTVMAASQHAHPRVRCVNLRNCHNGTADYALVEREIIGALRSWLAGYRVKIETVGYGEEIRHGKARMRVLAQETAKLQKQLENAYDLVEQGVYTLPFFMERRERLTEQRTQAEEESAALGKRIQQLENSEAARGQLIPATEALLESYEDMTPQEKNKLLKVILSRILYEKGEDGKIVIDLYPFLPPFDPEKT